MSRDNYTPIDCELHELYQLASMRRAWLDLRWSAEQGGLTQGRLRVCDVYTRARAEYLLAETDRGERLEIRLDRIERASWAESGLPLAPALG